MTDIILNFFKGLLYAHEVGLAISVACLALIVVCCRQNNKEDK